jgi:hypothetical protein
VALWVAAVLLAAYTRIRAGGREVGIRKYGSREIIVATLILPIAVLTMGFVFGLDVGMRALQPKVGTFRGSDIR